MSATTWFVIGVVGFSLAAVLFVISLFLFIKLNVPAVIGDLTGRTVAREIKAMRDANAASGDKRFRSSKVNLERGMVTEKVIGRALDTEEIKKAHASKRLDKTTGQLKNTGDTGKGGTAGLFETRAGRDESPQTELLASSDDGFTTNATEILNQGETELLQTDATEVLERCGTEVLQRDETVQLSGCEAEIQQDPELYASPGGTTVLAAGTTVLEQTEELEPVITGTTQFRITRSEIVVHSREVI